MSQLSLENSFRNDANNRLTSFQIADWMFKFDEEYRKRPKESLKLAIKKNSGLPKEPQNTFYMHKRRAFLDPRTIPRKNIAISSRLPENKGSNREISIGRRGGQKPKHYRSESQRETRLNQLLEWCESQQTDLTQLEAQEKEEKQSLVRWRHLQRLHKKMRSYEPSLVGELYLQHLEIEDMYTHLLN